MTSKVDLATPSYSSPTWNVPLNSNFTILNTAFGGVLSAAITTSDVTLSVAQAQNAVIILSGTLTGNRVLNLPNGITGTWTIYNGTSGSYTVTVKSDGGGSTGTVVTQGYSRTIYAAVVAPSVVVEVYSSESNVVKKSGDVMTGNLALPSNGLIVGTDQLYVSGGNVYTSGNFYATSNVTAYNTSDERLKDDISTIIDSLDKVSKLRGVSFTSKKDGKKCVGVIAQEVQKVLPEIVEEGEDGYLYVAYGNLISVLINAINDLRKRVEDLEDF